MNPKSRLEPSSRFVRIIYTGLVSSLSFGLRGEKDNLEGWVDGATDPVRVQALPRQLSVDGPRRSAVREVSDINCAGHCADEGS
jgi:hypothetical protein